MNELQDATESLVQSLVIHSWIRFLAIVATFLSYGSLKTVI
jgi:hypothetical protein